MASISSMGTEPGLQGLGEEEFQQIKYLTVNAHEHLRESYVFSGKFISGVSAIDQELVAIVVHLLNPSAPLRVVLALKGVKAFTLRDLLTGLLPPDWVEGRQLLKSLRELSDFRNKLAHGTLQNFHVEASGIIVEQTYLVTTSQKNYKFLETKEPLSFDDRARWDARLRVTMLGISALLQTLAMVDMMGKSISNINNLTLLRPLVQESNLEPPLTEIELEVLNSMFPADASGENSWRTKKSQRRDPSRRQEPDAEQAEAGRSHEDGKD